MRAQQHLDPIDQVASGSDRPRQVGRERLAGEQDVFGHRASNARANNARATYAQARARSGHTGARGAAKAVGDHKLVSLDARYKGVGWDNLAEVLDGAAEQFYADVVAERLAGLVNAGQQDGGEHERPFVLR